MNRLKGLNAALWGNSIALSWMWGLGLFFSVQITFQFGLAGLLGFAIPNALGLVLFGFLTQIVANRNESGDSLRHFFMRWSKPFRLVFFLYQLLAITLTVFAVLHYLFLPLEFHPDRFYWLFLPLTAVIVIAAGCLFGEEFELSKIKYGHLIQAAIGLTAILIILFGLRPFEGVAPLDFAIAEEDLGIYVGYLIPICIGFLVGPWLDLQQWQRAIQIHKEGASVRKAYLFGAAQFFLMLLFHGGLTYWVIQGGFSFEPAASIDNLPYAHHLVVEYMKNVVSEYSYWIPLAYYFFIGVCVLTTLDSGYIALRWFLTEQIKRSNNTLFSVVPQQIFTSPIPSFLFAAVFSVFGVAMGLELEYFMVFYASFFVGYATLAIARCFVPNSQHPLPQIRMFSMGALSVVIFAYGYLRQDALLMILGSIMPLGYTGWLVLNTDLLKVVTEKAEEVIDAASEEVPAIRRIRDKAQTVWQGATAKLEGPVEAIGGHFEGKWFVHSFLPTYADTNSVGNVYFGMYAMWVGKTRELFFNQAMPEFDLKDTTFYILTRNFEHKFIRETREFERVTVKIRVSGQNRKQAFLEHAVYNDTGQLLGKGTQTLIFVDSKDYRLLDIPGEVTRAFMPYL
jgi:acyl-CoA thioesterase FadM